MNLKEELTPILQRWTDDAKKVKEYYEINMNRLSWMENMRDIGMTKSISISEEMMKNGHIEEYIAKFEDATKEEAVENMEYRLENFGHLFFCFEEYMNETFKIVSKHKMEQTVKKEVFEWELSVHRSSFEGVAEFCVNILKMNPNEVYLYKKRLE